MRFQALKNQALLVGPPVGVVMHGGDPVANTVIVGPPFVSGQLAAERDVNRLAGRQVANHCDEEPIQDVGRDVDEIAPDDEGLDRFETDSACALVARVRVDLRIDVQ